MSEQPRRSSFSMLSRRKSGNMKKGKKAQQAALEAELQRQALIASQPPPKLPQLYNGLREPVFETRDSVAIFGLDSARSQSQQARSPPRHQIQNRAPSMEAPRVMPTSVPIPAIPGNGGAWVDPYARTESMTNRGRYSYASSSLSTVNNPRKVRRRKDPTPFNVLIVGARGAGKTSFIEFLKTALALPPKKRSTSRGHEDDVLRAQPTGNFYPHYVESEIDGERVGLTLWDSEGLEKSVVDLQLREMSTFVESKFEETFAEEMKVIRSPGVQDTHIHCAFVLLDPARLDKNIAGAKALAFNGNGKIQHSRVVGSLDEDLDIQVLRALQGKTTAIPIIAKADTITTKHMQVLKKTVWDSLKKADLDPLEVLGLEDEPESRPSSTRIAEEGEEWEDEAAEEDAQDDEILIQRQDSDKSKASKRQSVSDTRRSVNGEDVDEIPYIPMSIISPDIYEPEVIGRKFPWGFADPNNEEHCDFLRLKEAVFSEWRGELKEASRDQWYEGWRTSRLKLRDGPVLRR